MLTLKMRITKQIRKHTLLLKVQSLINQNYHNYSAAFNYNKSGVEVQHNGLQWIQETVAMETVALEPKFNASGSAREKAEFKYKFRLKPIYEIANVRENSPAANAGLQKGDIILKINNTNTFKYSLQDLNSIFRSENDKWISLEVERNSQIIKFRFQLDDVL